MYQKQTFSLVQSQTPGLDAFRVAFQSHLLDGDIPEADPADVLYYYEGGWSVLDAVQDYRDDEEAGLV